MTSTIDVEDIISKLDIVEKCSLLAGDDWWHTVPIPRLNVPSVRVSDGPNGVRGTRFFNGIKAACFPCGTALGATWDVDLLRAAGEKMGDEAKAKGAHVILGPTVNMHRSPLGGRGFESFSEDPWLAGLTCAAVTSGIQDTGVVATVKHFLCNDQEHERNGVNVIVTERALREIYALPFQLVVKESNPGCFMTSYNKVNGIHVSENKKLMQDMLRGEWGWEGMIMSDWWGTYSTSESVNAGLDLEMPGGTRWRGELLTQARGVYKVLDHVLDERVRNVLNLVNRCAGAKIADHAEEKAANTPETAALLRKIGGESIVLLKNEDNVLPLKKDIKTLIIGPNAKLAAYHGGGSASLNAYYAITPFAGISSQLTAPPTFTEGCYAHKELPLLGYFLTTANNEPGILFKTYDLPSTNKARKCVDEITLQKSEFLLMDYKPPGISDPLWYADIEGWLVAEEDCVYEVGMGVYGTAQLFVNDELLIDNLTKQTKGTMFFNCGTIEEKGRLTMKKGVKYTFRIEFGSAPSCKLARGHNVLFGGGAVRLGGCKVIDPEEEVAHAARLAKEHDQVIICAGLNADWETEGADRENMDLPGHMDALIAAVSAANPSTVVVMQSGTPVAMPWISSVKGLVQAWYGGNETGNAIADVLFGNVNPGAKLPLSFPKRIQDNPSFVNYVTERGRTLYGEDVYIGYRWYEMLDLPVLFPFGHGLSYTTFSLAELKVSKSDAEIKVSVQVTNTGEREGAEVVQIYIAQKAPSIRRPKKELRGFKKVLLGRGESKTVELVLETKYATSFWDELREAWISEKDEYAVLVGSSSETKTALKDTFNVEKTTWWNGL